MAEFFENMANDNYEIAQTLLDEYENNRDQLYTDLATIMGTALEDCLSPDFVTQMKNIGWGYSLMNTIPNITSPVGDHIILGKDELGQLYIDDNSKLQDFKYLDEMGQEQSASLEDRGAQVMYHGGMEFAAKKRNHTAVFGKGMQYYWDKLKQQYEAFKNAVGSGLSRQAGVSIVQSTDGDALKLTLAYVNGGRKVPIPVSTVHDAIRTTPQGLLHYMNAYNNVAIPVLRNGIRNFADKITTDFSKQKEEFTKEILQNGNPVGIGLAGKYPAVGGYLDAIQEKVNNLEYKNSFIQRSVTKGEKNPTTSYNKWRDDKIKMLKIARDLGWIPENGIVDANKESISIDSIFNTVDRDRMAIKPGNFIKLFNLLLSDLRLEGPSETITGWKEKFKNHVDKSYDSLKRHAKNKGISQMGFR